MSPVSINDLLWPCDLDEPFKRAVVELMSVHHDVDELRKAPKHLGLSGLTYIHSGVGIIYTYTGDDAPPICAIVGRGDWVGANGLESYQTLPIYAEQLTDCTLYHISMQDLRTLESQYGDFYKFMYFCLANIQPKYMQHQHVLRFERDARLAFGLMELSSYFPEQGAPSISITQEKLGMLVQMSRPRINEALNILETQGLIELGHGRITVVDTEALKQRASIENLLFRDADMSERDK